MAPPKTQQAQATQTADADSDQEQQVINPPTGTKQKPGNPYGGGTPKPTGQYGNAQPSSGFVNWDNLQPRKQADAAPVNAAPANAPNPWGTLDAAVASCRALADSAGDLARDAENHKVPDAKITAGVASFNASTSSIARDLGVDVSLLWDYRSTFSVDNHTQPIPKADTERAAHYVDKIKMYLSAAVNSIAIVQQNRPKVQAAMRTRDVVGALNDIERVVGLPTTDPDTIADNSLVAVHGDIIPADSNFNDPTREIERLATAMAMNWQSLVTNFSLGVDRLQGFLDTMKPDPEQYGAIKDAIWDKAQELLTAATAPIAGSELAAKIGIKAIEAIIKAGKAKETAQIQADTNAFKQSLRDMADTFQRAKGTPKEADGALVSNPNTTGTSTGVASDELAAMLYREFRNLGGSDGWKPGDKSVVGPQAHFIKELQHQKEEYSANIRTERDYEGELLTAFVRANHKERAVGPIRSPLAAPTEMDGYIEIPLVLDAGTNLERDINGQPRALSSYHLAGGEEGTLHCLEDGASGKIAARLMEDLPHFKAAESRIAMRLRVTAESGVKKGLPEFVRNKMESISMIDVQGGGYIPQGPQRDLWDWVETSCNTNLQEVLARMTKVVG